MDYILSFLEGVITFISPCLLPMLPVYVSYFTGPVTGIKKGRALVNSFGFVIGFTAIFVTLGAFAGTVGKFLNEYRTAFNIFSGILLILFGLNYMEIIKVPFINTSKRIKMKAVKTGFFSSVVFGMVFSVGWTPCIGAFLGSALMLAAQGGESIRGVLMLLCFSLGLGIPFIISALLIERLKSSFDFIKKHYRIINIISGCVLIIIGILMMTGTVGYLLSLLSI